MRVVSAWNREWPEAGLSWHDVHCGQRGLCEHHRFVHEAAWLEVEYISTIATTNVCIFTAVHAIRPILPGEELLIDY